MKKGRGSRYKKLLEDPEVRRWYENNARGSIITADVYLRRLGNFCKTFKFTPGEFAANTEKNLYKILLDYVSKLEDEGKTGSYIESIIKALRSWLSYNDKVINKKIKIKGTRATPTLKDERVPTPQELKRIFFAGDRKSRVVGVLVAHSGLRLETLGNYLGDDGLCIGDFPELGVKKDTVEFTEIPSMVTVRAELSKAGHKYFSFLSEEGCEYMKDYLEERLRGGEKLNKNSPIVQPKTARKRFISTTNIGDTIRVVIRKSGFSWRPYVLRSYFDTQLMLAESQGLLLRDYRTLWMGHKGDIEHKYTTNKGRLPSHVIDDMREAYRKSQEFLQTKAPSGPKEEELKHMFRTELMRMAGYNDKEIEVLLGFSDDEFMENVRSRLLGAKINSNCQKAIMVNEIETYLQDGWEFVSTLPNNKVIVRYPH
jgi:hypothetical protein